ncbi:MAG: hypothetical protein GX601_03515, partial [Anaerolineales bacterium]|nr:hypothetical protein [Anaerolineales bacterium]
MDYGRIVKRAFQITWRYRALWVFGIILAIASGAGNSGGGGGGSGAQAQVGTGLGVPAQTEAILITALIGLVCLILALTVITAIARYVAETALIRMVDEYEETDQKHTVGKGFRLGWSRSAWRLFLIDLVVVLPLVVAFILLFVIALAPLLLWLTEDQTLGTIGTVTTIGLVVLVILLIIVVATAISVLLHFIRRACVLESLGTIDAIKHGVA